MSAIFHKNKLISSWDLVKQFDPSLFAVLIRSLALISRGESPDKNGPFRSVNDQTTGDAGAILRGFGLNASAQSVDRIVHELQNEAVDSVPHEWVKDSTQELSGRIVDELKSQFFLFLPAEDAAMYSQPRKGWELILEVFPASCDDVIEMNKCFALERYTASIFHCLLVVEHGLISLGRRIGATDPKEGWDATCKRLESIVKAGHIACPSGLSFAFLEQVNALIQSMKHAWRNKINHSAGKPVVVHSDFSGEIAREIVMASRALMRTLAQGLKVPENQLALDGIAIA